MARSKDPVRKLAASAKRMKAATKPKALRESITESDERGKLIKSDPPNEYFGTAPELEGPAKWSECPPDIRALEANRATTLGFFGKDAPIRKAFNRFGLDPQNPWHWRELLYCMADAHDGENKVKGAKWTKDRLHRLYARAKGYPGVNDSEKEKNLRRDYPKDYGFFSDPGTLRKHLRMARKLFEKVEP